MRYRTLTEQDVKSFADLLLSDATRANSVFARTFCAEFAGEAATPGRSNQPEFDYGPLGVLAESIESHVRTNVNASKEQRELFEGAICGSLHKALANADIEMLDDSRFWHFIAVNYFTTFIGWRESDALKDGRVSTYFIAKSGVESVPLRLFLRAQVVSQDNDYSLATAIPKGTDFWRSHVLRVKTGRAADVAIAFVRMQSENPLTTKPLRSFAKLINRMWANVVPHELDQGTAKQLLEELRKEI